MGLSPLDLKLEHKKLRLVITVPVEVPERRVHDDSFDGRTVASLILGQELLQLLCESPTMAAGSPSNRSLGPTKRSHSNLRIQDVQIQNVQSPGAKRPKYNVQGYKIQKVTINYI